MKIALSFPGCHRRAGVERIVFECARYLSQREHDVSVFAGEWEEDPMAPRIKYCMVPYRRSPSFLSGYSYFVNSSRAIHQEEFDVLNTHGSVCPTGGVQWVQSIQRAWLEVSRRLRPPWSWQRVRQRLNPLHKVLLHLENKHFRERRYKKLIGTTPHIREDLHRLYDVPREDVVIIPNGFAEGEFNPARRATLREEMRAELGLLPDHVALVFVANELMRKGYYTLLRALQQLNAPELRVLVVGRTQKEAVLKAAAEAKLSDQILFCGATPDVGRYHAAADAFVLPTQYEAYCLAILEALGSGLPVITTRVPGAQDAIQPGINGELVDPDHAEELSHAIGKLRDPDRRAEYSRQAPESVADFRWSRVLARYEQVLMQHSARH